MASGNREIVFRLNSRSSVTINCPAKQTLTCEVPVKPVGVLLPELQHRWIPGETSPDHAIPEVDCIPCTPFDPRGLAGLRPNVSAYHQANSPAAVEEEIHCNQANDTEIPFIPVFVPGLSSAPPTNETNEHQHLRSDCTRAAVEEEIHCNQANDTEIPFIPVFVPGLSSAPPTNKTNEHQHLRSDCTRAAVEEEIHCNQANDTEIPFIPVFVPGLSSAPPTNETNGPQHTLKSQPQTTGQTTYSSINQSTKRGCDCDMKLSNGVLAAPRLNSESDCTQRYKATIPYRTQSSQNRRTK